MYGDRRDRPIPQYFPAKPVAVPDFRANRNDRYEKNDEDDRCPLESGHQSIGRRWCVSGLLLSLRRIFDFPANFTDVLDLATAILIVSRRTLVEVPLREIPHEPVGPERNK